LISFGFAFHISSVAISLITSSLIARAFTDYAIAAISFLIASSSPEYFRLSPYRLSSSSAFFAFFTLFRCFSLLPLSRFDTVTLRH